MECLSLINLILKSFIYIFYKKKENVHTSLSQTFFLTLMKSYDNKKKESNNDIFGDIHVAKDKIMAFPLKAAYKEAKKKRTQAEICMESRTKK